MVKRFHWLLCCCLKLPCLLAAQELPVWSFYVPALPYLNAGSLHADTINYAYVAHRSQWVNYTSSFGHESGAIVSNLCLWRYKKKRKSNHAWGLTFLNDNTIGILHNEIRFMYAYRVKLSKKSLLSLGMSLDGIHKRINVPKYRVEFPTDSHLPFYASEIRPDMSTGLYWKHKNGTFGGVGINRMLKSYYPALFLQSERFFHITIGKSVPLSSAWKLLPSLIAYRSRSYATLETTLSLHYQNLVQMGIAYRNQEMIGFLFSVQILENKLMVYYSAEHILRAENAKTNLSQELALRYNFR